MRQHLEYWWHWRILGHTQHAARVSPPAFDPSAKGLLIRCGCGKVWAW